MSIMDFHPERRWDFVLVKTVLIHMPPEILPAVYDVLHAASERYVCMVEYYNPTPVKVVYRGHENKLFKRDFAGEFSDRFNEVRLVDYGFVYHRDPRFPQDDVTWFLFDKKPE
jgi:spore coat polysaccharide biosynthesis protein SpsF